MLMEYKGIVTMFRFVEKNSLKSPTIQKDEVNKQTVITSSNKVVITVLTLTHI